VTYAATFMLLTIDSSVIHIAIVEDDVHFRDAMVSSLMGVDDIKLVAEASTRVDGMRLLQGPPVDVLLVDLGLPDGSGIDIIRAASEQWPACDIMVRTTFGDESHIIRSLEAGAAGYLLKDSDPHPCWMKFAVSMPVAARSVRSSHAAF